MVEFYRGIECGCKTYVISINSLVRTRLGVYCKQVQFKCLTSAYVRSVNYIYSYGKLYCIASLAVCRDCELIGGAMYRHSSITYS